ADHAVARGRPVHARRGAVGRFGGAVDAIVDARIGQREAAHTPPFRRRAPPGDARVLARGRAGEAQHTVAFGGGRLPPDALGTGDGPVGGDPEDSHLRRRAVDAVSVFGVAL